MEITDFYFVGHSIIGPRICSKIGQKGVRNPMKLIGENSSRIYFVQKSKNNIFTLYSEGKETPFGQNIIQKRKQITVDRFQNFLLELSKVVLPEMKKVNRFTNKQVEDIIRMVMDGYTSCEIANKLGVKTVSISSKVHQLRLKNIIPSKEECKLFVEKKKKLSKYVKNGVLSNQVDSVVSDDNVLNRRIRKAFMAKDIACKLISTGIIYGDKELAIKACNIAEEILKRCDL